jgi:hypothetical protein
MVQNVIKMGSILRQPGPTLRGGAGRDEGSPVEVPVEMIHVGVRLMPLVVRVPGCFLLRRRMQKRE